MAPEGSKAAKKRREPERKDVDEEEEEEEESSEEEDSEDEEDLDGSEGDDEDEEIMVDFEFQDPKEIDFHGLKALLGNYLDGAEFSSSELCDAIIKQSTVGTVVKSQGAGDESDPIAVMSVINLHQKKDAAYIKQISAYLKKKCPKDLKEQLSAVLAEKGVGLIINERVINVPQETAPPLVDGLFDEIEWATEDEPTEELRDSFKFKKYVMFSRVFQDDDQEANKKRKREDGHALVYMRPEDQFFHKVCKWSFQWKAKDSEDKNDIEVFKPLRLCMLVDASSVPTVRSELKKLFSNLENLT